MRSDASVAALKGPDRPLTNQDDRSRLQALSAGEAAVGLPGMGAVVLNGARIGRGSLVAAGAVVAQGVQVPPGSLVAGVPGKVRRELTDEEYDGVRANAARYSELAADHRELHASQPAP